ncbi:MAG: AsmA family protein [Hyphomicrobiales bacterium]|nr:AsmA family protein [Hyphomicrobiales bacterium]
MNSLYIGVGFAIILALVTALVGPYFVDWGTHRAVFEAEASRIVGLPVKVLGDVDARLLPAPRVRFGDVVIGDLARPTLRVGRFELDLDVAGLVRGETRVSDLVLDRPAVDAEIDGDGRMVGLPERAADLADVRIETIRFVDGRLRLHDARTNGEWSATRLEGRGTVESLAGAWRIEAKGFVEGRAGTLRIAARRGSDGPRLRLSGGLDDGPTLSGDLTIGGESGRPRAMGALTLERAGTETRPTIAVSGATTLDADGLSIDDLAVRFGEEGDTLRLTGSARAAFSPQARLEATLQAKRIDLDAGRGAAAGGARARLTAMIDEARALLAETRPPRATRLSVSLDAASFAGGLVTDLSAEIATRPGGITIERFETRLPGEAKLAFAGRADLTDRILDGTGSLAVAAPESLAAWWSGEAVGDRRIGDLSLAGAFTLSRDGFSGGDLELGLGAAKARGRVESRADGLLRLGLSAERLDGERLAALLQRSAHGRSGFGRGGLDLDLDVRALTFGKIVGRGARVALHAGGDAIAIDRLALADLAGARISISGRIADLSRTPNGRLEAEIAAEKPGPATRVLADLVSPGLGAVAEPIGAAAGPLDVALVVEGRRDEASGEGGLEASATGHAAGGALTLAARWAGRLDDAAHGRLDGRLSLDGATISDLAARLLDAKPKDRVILTGTVAGRASEGLGFAFEAGLGDRRVSAEGSIVAPETGSPRATWRGRLVAPDVGLLAGFAGDPIAALERRIPVDVEATAWGWGATWTVSRLAGAIADARIEASGDVDLGGRRDRVTGRLAVDRAEIATLAGIAFGLPFDATLDTTIATLDLPGERSARAVSAKASVEAGALRVEGLRAEIGAARLEGDLRARRGESGVAVSGRLAGAIADFDTGRDGRRPALAGRLGGDLAFEASGDGPAALAASLSGSGRLRLDDGRLSGVGLEALRAPREGEGSAEAVIGAMTNAVTRLPPLDLPLIVEKGRLQTPRSTVALEAGRLTGRASGDLVADRIDGGLSVEPAGEATRARLSAVSHAAPSLDLTLSGGLDDPRLDYDPAGLDAFLTLHRLEREIEAAETARQDRIERLRFSSLLKRLEERKRAREAPPSPAPVAPMTPPATVTPSIVAPSIVAPPDGAATGGAGEGAPSAAPRRPSPSPITPAKPSAATEAPMRLTPPPAAEATGAGSATAE